MRRAIVLATALTLIAGAASAETWTKYVDGANGTQWSYDRDYTYKDKQSGRLVVMQAISKPEIKLGPSGPGKPDGVGSVVAIDCAKKTLITLGAYKPSAPLAIKDTWRDDTPKKVEGAEHMALITAVCAGIDSAPVR